MYPAHHAGTNLIYTVCCNHLTTFLSQLPEYIQCNWNISGISIGKVKMGSICNTDCTINTTVTIKD